MSFPPSIVYKTPQAKNYEDFKMKKLGSCSSITPQSILGSSRKGSLSQDAKSFSPIKMKPKFKISDFAILRTLGRGMFGQVFLAVHLQTGFICAIKIVVKSSLQGKDEQETKKFKNQLVRQIKIQTYMNHPNIIKLYSVFDDEQHIYLMMEMGTDGQLYSLLRKNEKLAEETTSFLVRQILLGINYMHDNQIIHRDVKPENIILTFGTIKLCDFGWSVYCPKEIRSTVCGTPLYFSPELLKGKQYDEKIDTWAVGILTHELVTGQNPFHIRKRQQIVKIITDNFTMGEGSKSTRNFIELALQKDPHKRIAAKQMLKHPFIRKYEGMQFCEELVRCF